MKRFAKLLAVVLAAVVGISIFKAVSYPETISKAANNIDYFYGFNTPFLPFDTAENISAELGYIPQCSQASATSVKPSTLRVFLPSSGIGDLKKLFANSPPNIKYIVTLSNYWGAGAQGPGCDPRPPYNSCQTPPSKWYQDNSNQSSPFQQYVKNVVNEFKSEGRVFMWEIMNEPSCDSSPDCSQARANFIGTTANTIQSQGGGILVSPGLQAQDISELEYQSITNLPGVSANTCHMYPENANINDPTIQRCLSSMDYVKNKNKVFYIGEVGFENDNPSCSIVGSTSETINRASDLRKIEAMFTTDRKLSQSKADGFLLWRFDPPQSGPQTCDKFSIFPSDPICGGSGNFTYQNPPGGPDFSGPNPTNPNASENSRVYPPLGSFQSCPPEIQTEGKVETITVSPGINQSNANYCNISPIYEEPAMCFNPPEPNTDASSDFCNGPTYAAWCNPDQCKAIATAHKSCAGVNHDEIGGCGKFYKFCTDPGAGPNGDGYWLNRLKKAKASTQGCNLLNSDDRDTIGRCMGYLKVIPKEPNKIVVQNQSFLPTCVPTKSIAQNRCTTTCGDPLAINSILQMNVSGPCLTGKCAANVNIDPSTPLYVPLAKDLADYFDGSLDAGAVAEGRISQDEFDAIKKAFQTGQDRSKIEEGFAKAGVAKKLLPVEIQDQLKCQFVKYVWNKIAKGENTKYKYKLNGQDEVFKIDGIRITEFKLPPYFDPDPTKFDPSNMNVGCRRISTAFGPDENAWSQKPSGKAWSDVPLFNNDEAQGAIEFVSASPGNSKPEPIKTSIPEINRLQAATNILQLALIPTRGITIPNAPPTPTNLKLTIGPEIKVENNLLVCKKTQTLKDVYNNTPASLYAIEPGTPSYTLGVECTQNGGAITQDPNSTSQVCSIGPDGQINCTQSQPADSGRTGIKEFDYDKESGQNVLQVRNVQPYLFDVFLNTIDKSGGLLRIFKPEFKAQQGNSPDARDEFEKKYIPLPAESNKIKYTMQSASGGVTIADTDQKKDGWKLLFDKLGGVWTARNFVLELLNPPQK